jgi:hypothetical protein
MLLSRPEARMNMTSIHPVQHGTSHGSERSDAPLDGVARDLGSLLFSMSSLVTRLQRNAPLEEPLDEIDDMLTQAILLSRLLSMRLHAPARRRADDAVEDGERSSVRIEVRGADGERDGRVALLVRQIVATFGGDVEVQSAHGGAAVIVRLNPRC